MNFKELNLDDRIGKAIEEAGYTTPTPIQESVIPLILEGHDLLASAQTGTGKTAAFLLPALQKLTLPSTVDSMGPRIVILVPTRELALQISKEAEKMCKYLPKVRVMTLYGGSPYPIQIRQLRRHTEIVVATPGRFIDHLDAGRIDLSRLEMLILDEADRMLDMGFIGPVEKIADACPAKRQTLLFSATLKPSVKKLVKKLMKDPKEITVIPAEERYEHITQDVYMVNHLTHKMDILKHLLLDPAIKQALIFTSTKRFADELADDLQAEGHSVSALHGDMNQRERQRTLNKLRDGTLKLLVATDVAARGIDILSITHVVNFDLPRCIEDYTHRIGRTGRAGALGHALSFAAPGDRYLVREIEAHTKRKFSVQVVKGLEPAAAPSRSGPPRHRPPSSNNRKPPFRSGRFSNR